MPPSPRLRRAKENSFQAPGCTSENFARGLQKTYELSKRQRYNESPLADDRELADLKPRRESGGAVAIARGLGVGGGLGVAVGVTVGVGVGVGLGQGTNRATSSTYSLLWTFASARKIKLHKLLGSPIRAFMALVLW
jgi:hypothetical protein